MKPSLIGFIVLFAVFSGNGTVNTTITVMPNATVALINDSTFFNCSTTSVGVNWVFGSSQYPEPIIYSHGAIKPYHKDRFRVQNYSNEFGNRFNLILLSVAKTDAGRYICHDRDRPEERMEVNLTVLETEPVCESNLNVSELIGPNGCAVKLKPDTVQLSCSVRYNGSQVPELQWTKADEDVAINASTCSASGNIYTCNLRMQSELRMDGASYVCQTTKSRAREYNCTSDVLIIMYALFEHKELTRSENDTVNCSVNSSSQSCTYSWKYDNVTINRTESYDPVIKLKRPGRYICESTCQIKDINCTIAAMTVYVNINAVLRNVFGDRTELNKTVNDTANCSFNSSSHACIFSWIFDNGTTNWTESNKRVIEFQRPGRFICEAICEIWNNTYTLAILTVYVTVNAELQGVDEFNAGKVIGSAVGAVVGGAAVIGICIGVGLYLWNKKRKNASKRRDPLELLQFLSPENVPDAKDLPEQTLVQTEQLSTNVEHVAEVEASNEQDQPGGDNILRTIAPMAKENYNKRVNGLTILKDELFVVFDVSKIVEIFPIDADASNCTNRSFLVKNLKDPVAIAACTTNNWLYILDHKKSDPRREIFRIEPINGTKINSWSTNGERGRLSVTSNGNVVMTVFDVHVLKIYSPDGSLTEDPIRVDPSGASIDYIYHAINVANGNFILCHGMHYEVSQLHRVCQIDRDGNLLKSFGSEKGSDNAHLSSPVYLVERGGNVILVADKDNDRIILLSSKLDFKTVLFTKENGNVNRPEAMCIYEKTGPPRIFVCCNKESFGYVQVLRLD